MVTGVYVPRWGITMENATVAAWLVKEDEPVVIGQDLAELETEKIVNVVQAPAAGVLRRILVPKGENASVGALLGVIAEAGEAFDLEALRGAGLQVEAAGPGERQQRAGRPAEKDQRGRVRASPPARRLAGKHGLDLAILEGTGPEGSVSRDDVERAIGTAVARSLEEGDKTVGGVTLHYMSVGGEKTGLNTSSIPVILVHGIAGSTLLWQANLSALGTVRKVIAVDLPGHGRSGKPAGPCSIELFTRSILGFLDACGFEKVVLAGHSLGGHVCLKLALERPERVTGLVLIDSGGLGPEIDVGFLKPLLSGATREAAETMLRGLFANPAMVNRSMVDATFEALSRPGALEAVRDVVESAAPRGIQVESLTERLPELRVPVLIAWGARDAVIPVAQGKEAHASIPGAELWVAENAGHCPQIEAASEFNDRLLKFLD
ncbi:MAG: acetoin dehydrogenase dihydrolipoyllysine-residue acetyltransferase subunit [Desulfobacteria bacterium]